MEIEEDSEHEITPEEIIEKANVPTLNLLPEKSREIYIKEYNTFMEWCNHNGVHSFTEPVLLAFFEDKAKNFKSSTLWSSYSKIKATLIINNNVDISKYSKLITYLKGQSAGYKPKKSQTFSSDEINKFLLEAPDEKYLMFKVTLILGVAGACRREELYKTLIDNIEDKGAFLLVTIQDLKTLKQRCYTVIGETDIPNLNLLDIYRKYAKLRPKNADNRHFFLSYRNEKCTKQVVGINTFSKIPSLIAKYLNLPQPETYTGHTFRRTAAALLLDSEGFPKNQNRRSAWIKAISRIGWEPQNNSSLSSEHLPDDCFDRTALSCVRLRELSAPTNFPSFSSHLQKENQTSCDYSEDDDCKLTEISPISADVSSSSSTLTAVPIIRISKQDSSTSYEVSAPSTSTSIATEAPTSSVPLPVKKNNRNQVSRSSFSPTTTTLLKELYTLKKQYKHKVKQLQQTNRRQNQKIDTLSNVIKSVKNQNLLPDEQIKILNNIGFEF